MNQHLVLKRDAKASVFTHLFSLNKYKRELYLSFYPRDANIKDEEIETYTLSSIFTNIQINDLGLLVKDTMLVLVEAQSIWTMNILPRMFEYLAESFNRYVHDTDQNIYGSKKVYLPRPELYVLYTGDKTIKQKTISFKTEFFKNDCSVDVIVKVITLNNSSNVLKEYIMFTKVLDDNNKKLGYTKDSIVETINYCVNHNILKEYLNEYKKEVYNIMISLYDQETATQMYGRSQFAEGKAEGIEQGRKTLLQDLHKKGLITKDQAIELSNGTLIL